MIEYQKTLKFGENLLIILALAPVFVGILPLFEGKNPKIEAEIAGPVLALSEVSELVIFQGNSLASLSNPNNPEPKVISRIMVIATAYSSSVWQTDETPHLTAAGTWVRDGIIANNYLSFGTKVRIPELYGDKIFVVEDRMNWKKGNYQIDIWFPDYWQALNFGAKTTYIEILES